MPSVDKPVDRLRRRRVHRDWFERVLGFRQQRRVDIYLELSQSASLIDGSYWLQVFFSAGIATLGLALNSPAVIIGAMLISPLMGPILANGLAFASGDLILGIRAAIKLVLSCLLAVTFASTLVAMLPFKEITAEVAARSHPNTLDLAIALFSGAIGAIAVCKETKGVATSIPGVAIAVALMPPLCIVGYGAGIAVSVNSTEGGRIAYGGALLFFTNLVAITLTAMIVFMALHMKVENLPDDSESFRVREFLNRYPWLERMRAMNTRARRFLTLLVIIGIILVPLSQSFSQLKREFVQKQAETRIRADLASLWQEHFARLPNGDIRSYIGQSAIALDNGDVSVQINVFTNKPYTTEERAEYTRLVAARLNKPADAVRIQLVEVPTSAGELAARPVPIAPPPAPLTVAQLQKKLLESVDPAVRAVRLPDPARLLNYDVATGPAAPFTIKLAYLSSRDIDPDAQSLIAQELAQRVAVPDAVVNIERVESVLGPIQFARIEATLNEKDKQLLDRAAATLRRFANLQMEIHAATDAQGKAIVDYMSALSQIAPERMPMTLEGDLKGTAMLEFMTAGSARR